MSEPSSASVRGNWHVLNGESSKRLALPRNTKDRKHLQQLACDVHGHHSLFCRD